MASTPFIYSSHFQAYNFGPGHPFTPLRWKALRELVEASALPVAWIESNASSDEEILTVHSAEFVSAVKAASDAISFIHPGYFGLGTGDVPTFLGMHDATAHVVGGTVAAGEAVASGTAKKSLQLSGGLHHAMRDRASGFCVYNDQAVVIRNLRSRGWRVAYIDIDVHHGDGVQAIFYEDPNVLTVSLHESGAYLFPGTGSILETGGAGAEGTSVNVPLHPGTDDASYLDSFDAVVPEIVRQFAPDVIVLECGADAHAIDPLAHIGLTTHGFSDVLDRILALADEAAAGRLVAALGGGYAFDSTLRVWSMLAYKLCQIPLPELLPEQWFSKWETALTDRAWTRWHDERPRGNEAAAALAGIRNRETVAELLRLFERT